MPKNPDYSKTIIYKLINYDHPDLVYVGSTTNFTKRKSKHKSMVKAHDQTKLYKSIIEHGGWDSWHMIKICDYPCNSSIEARQAEDKHMMELKAALNTYKPYVSDEEKKEKAKNYYNLNKEKIKNYQELNKEKIKEKVKNYRESHKEKLSDYKKNYRESHKEELSDYKKNYRESHKEKLSEYGKNYYNLNKEKITAEQKCDCGCIVRKDNMSNHKKTKKHINLINSEKSQ